MKNEVINAILTDDLEGAESLIAKNPAEFKMFSNLLKKVKNNPIPLKEIKVQPPASIGILSSYTCGFHCEMCSSGFHDRTSLYDGYKYFLPEQFDKLSPWIEAASEITFVGLGETLNSPHIQYFLKKVRHKHSIIFTNGIPLNRKKIQSLINAELNSLVFSFDGKLSIGHGKGTEKYIQWFWKKVQLIQKIKKDFNTPFPVVKLITAVAEENIDDLDNVIGRALRHDITHVMLALMTPFNEKMFRNSVFANFDKSKRKINFIIAKWNKKGISVTVIGNTKKLRDSLKVCLFVDNWLHFDGRNNTLGVCCGSLEIPVCFSGTPQVNHWNSFPLRYFRYIHFSSNHREYPIACKNCWALNLKEYSKRCAMLYNNSKNKKNTGSSLLTLYNAASKMKQISLNSKAEKLFLEVLKLKADSELKGKVYFHLGEMQLRKKNYRQALRFMKLSVQYCFNHAMAFSYLYLLFMLLGKKNIKKIRKKLKLVIPE